MKSMRQTAALPAATADSSNLSALYQAHAAAVERWAARLAGPSLDVEDIVQEVFLIAHRQLPKFRGDSSLATWLFGITERVVWHQRRKVRSWQRMRAPVDEIDVKLPAAGPSPLDTLQSKEAAALFYRALDGVDERYRAALVLFEVEELSGQEIATLKGIRVETLWVWLHRARAQLLKALVRMGVGQGQERKLP
jgi:RNA polymerase sigma-70 factor (ECF subfamily)